MPVVEKVSFRGGRKRDFERWMFRQLANTIGDRASLERNWKDRIVEWRAKQPETDRDFPFPGASNMILPVTAMHSDPVYADLMTTLHASPDFWHVTPKRPDRVDHANAMREALTRLDQDFLHMRDVNKVAQLYTIVLGTGIYKHTFVDRTKTVRDYNDAGEIEMLKKRELFPKVQHVPLHYFYIPADAWSINPDAPVGGARWVAQKFFLTASQLQAKAKSDPQIVPPYDKAAVKHVLAFAEDRTKEESVDEKIQSEDDYRPFEDLKVELFEIWARFDVNDDGVDEDVVIIWHQETQTVLRATHNPFLHGQRPFEATRYLQGFGFYGIGTAEVGEWSQDALTKLMNAQIDNVLLANTRMFSVPEGSDVTPGEPIYPGKIWMTPPGEQIRALQMGDIYQSLPQIQGQIMQLAEQRTGVSELRQGNLTGLPSRTPATSLLSILKEGNKKFDEILGTMRQPLGRIGLRTIQNVSQWYREDPVFWDTYFERALGPEDAALVTEALNSPVTAMGETFGVEVKAVSSVANVEAEKQNFIAMLQVTSQIGGQLIQLAQMAEQAQGTTTGQVAESMYRGGVELLERLLERFGQQNFRDFLPPDSLQAAQQQSQQPGAGAGPQASPLGGPQAPGPFAQSPGQVGPLFGVG